MGAVLGRLQKVNIREYWEREDSDFTPWLAEDANIQLLGDSIGIELELEAREKEVGLFRADLLCKDTATGEFVLVENQLEKTDHTHLGQIITYASGLNAVTIVWIASRFTEEHRSALDWLNEVTDENLKFFGLEIELWKIGDSNLAPKFNVVASPNNWSKAIGEVAKHINSSALTEIKQLQVEYWTAFRDLAMEEAKRIKPTKPRPQNWMNLAIGRSNFLLQAIASTWNSQTESYQSGEIRAELCMTHRDIEESQGFFELLYLQKEEIEVEFGLPLDWDSQEERKVCRISLRQDADISLREDWERQHRWLVQNLDRMHEVFANRVKQLSL